MSFKETLMRTGSRAILKMKKHSPELLLGAGLIFTAAATVTACKATLHADEVLEKHQENMEKIKKAEELEAKDPEVSMEETVKNSRKDTVMVYSQTAVGMARLYALPVALGALGTVCILSSYGIMRKRNIALTAAYTALDAVHKSYRRRVIEEQGEDMDRHFRYGTEIEKIESEEKDEKGKVTAKTEEIEVFGDGAVSCYAKWFDEGSVNWEKDAEQNLRFLRGIEHTATDKLRCNGHLFLNEVYDMIGVPRTPAGAVVGWIYGNGDNYVDFGILDGHRRIARDFVNGYERSILLDFNVDGVIYDKI